MASRNGGNPAGLTLECSFSACGSEVIFAILLLVPVPTLPGSLGCSKKGYCLRHYLYLKKYNIFICFVKSSDIFLTAGTGKRAFP
jgi:hypothetical protein